MFSGILDRNGIIPRECLIAPGICGDLTNGFFTITITINVKQSKGGKNEKG